MLDLQSMLSFYKSLLRLLRTRHDRQEELQQASVRHNTKMTRAAKAAAVYEALTSDKMVVIDTDGKVREELEICHDGSDVVFWPKEQYTVSHIVIRPRGGNIEYSHRVFSPTPTSPGGSVTITFTNDQI